MGSSVIKYVVVAVFVCVMVGVDIDSRRRAGTVNVSFLGGREVGSRLSSSACGTT